MQLQVSLPANNVRGPQYMEQGLAAIHQAIAQHNTITLGIYGDPSDVDMFIRCPESLQGAVQCQLYAQYPSCHLAAGSADLRAMPAGTICWQADLLLARDIFSVKRHPQFEMR